VLRIDVDAADVEESQRHRVEALFARPEQDVRAVPAVLRIDVDAADVEESQRHRVEAPGARPVQDVGAVRAVLRIDVDAADVTGCAGGSDPSTVALLLAHPTVKFH
jgi:hypothetical protein